jgi:hypothetical protein
MSAMTGRPARSTPAGLHPLRLSAVRSSHPDIKETALVHVLTSIDVAQIDQDGTGHLLPHPVKIERPKLLPFRDDHQPVDESRSPPSRKEPPL